MEEIFDELIDHIQKVKKQYLAEQKIKAVRKNKLSTVFLNKVNYSAKVDNQEIRLTTLEFLLLEALLDSDQLFCTYEEICNKIYDYKYDSHTAMSLKILMSRLKKKLGDLITIKTQYSKGFEIVRIKGYDRKQLL